MEGKAEPELAQDVKYPGAPQTPQGGDGVCQHRADIILLVVGGENQRDFRTSGLEHHYLFPGSVNRRDPGSSGQPVGPAETLRRTKCISIVPTGPWGRY